MNGIFNPLNRWRLVTLIVLVIGLAILAWLHRDQLTREALMDYGKGLNAVVFVALFIFLPMLGFPVSVFLVLLGIRFGFPVGMAITAAVMMVHHGIAYRIGHGGFRERFRGWLDRKGYQFPETGSGEKAGYTAMFAALHGPPYAVKLYLLALADIPFRIYFWVGAPVYIGFSVIPVATGSSIMNFDPRWIYFLVFGLTAATVLMVWLKKRATAR